MIHDQGLPLFLWAEACNTVVYLQNRSSHRALGNVTPKEAFFGKKPDVGHFHIFGCLTYSYVPKENRTKLEPTTSLWFIARPLKLIGFIFLRRGEWLSSGM